MGATASSCCPKCCPPWDSPHPARIKLPVTDDEEAGKGVVDKLTRRPWLLCRRPGGLSFVNDLSTRGAGWFLDACEQGQTQVVTHMLHFLSSSSIAVVREALEPHCRRMDLPLPATVADGVHLAVSMVNSKGQTPLMLACSACSASLVRLLLVNGADPWAVDRICGRTALHYAAVGGSVTCIAALMEGIRVREQDGCRYIDAGSLCGFTALHYAVHYEHDAALRELLRHEPSLVAATTRPSHELWPAPDAQSTPLHLCAANANCNAARDILRHFTERRASPSNPDPRTPRNAAGKQAWQLVSGSTTVLRHLAIMLNPELSLLRALGMETGAQTTNRVGPPPLALLAARVVRQRLLEAVQAAAAAAGDGGALQQPAVGVERSCSRSLHGSECQARHEEEEQEGRGSHPFAVHAEPGERGPLLHGAELRGTHTGSQHAGAALSSSSVGNDGSGDMRGDARVSGAASPRDLPSFHEGSRRAGCLSPKSRPGAPALAGGVPEPASPTKRASPEVAAEEEDGDRALCALCCERRSTVAPAGCSHGVCATCATALCRAMTTKPLTCSWCRGVVTDWVPLTSTCH